jgi:flagellar biosynthesis protein FlhG
MEAAGTAVLEAPARGHANKDAPPSILTPSAPTGAVSYGPVRGITAMTSSLPTRTPRAAPRLVRLAKAIAVTSGKGGVGKSNLAVNLAVAMSTRGLKVCLLDGDLGLANADILCNLAPRLTLEHVMAGKCRLADVMMLAPGGFRLIPGASGVARLADLAADSRQALLEQLAALERVADVLIIDCGAGISANVVGLASAANTVVVATTPEPPAITDGYAMVKLLLTQVAHARVELVVNMVQDDREGHSVFRRIERVAATFMKRSPTFGGSIPMDMNVANAVRQRIPFVLLAPESPATRAIGRLASRLLQDEPPSDAPDPITTTQGGFFLRFASWLGLVEAVERDGAG